MNSFCCLLPDNEDNSDPVESDVQLRADCGMLELDEIRGAWPLGCWSLLCGQIRPVYL